ncbi:MAG: HAD family hydrolase [Actinomycetota bacterium]
MDHDLIIFDCDGVLVDSERIAVQIESRLLTEAGFPLTPAEIAASFVGLSYGSMMTELERRFGRSVPEELNQRMQSEALAAFPTELEPTPGIVELLGSITGPRCVASSSDPDRIALSLRLTGLDRWFDPGSLFSATMVDRGKPAPDLFLHAAAAMGHRPDRCVVIEDSPHGVEAAVAAGMAVVGYVGGGHAGPALSDRLVAAGADAIADHHRSVPPILGLGPGRGGPDQSAGTAKP